MEIEPGYHRNLDAIGVLCSLRVNYSTPTPTAGDATTPSSPAPPSSGSSTWKPPCPPPKASPPPSASEPSTKSSASPGTPPGAKSESPTWSPPVPTGASPASAYGASPSPSSSARVPARNARSCAQQEDRRTVLKRVRRRLVHQRTAAEEILPAGTACQACGRSREFRKEMDILDVWFESGASSHAVLDFDPDTMQVPANPTAPHRPTRRPIRRGRRPAPRLVHVLAALLHRHAQPRAFQDPSPPTAGPSTKKAARSPNPSATSSTR